MRTLSYRRLVIILVAICLLLPILSGCSTMEEKRDKFLKRGQELYNKDDFVRARLEFKNALQIDPKFAQGYLWLGKTEFKLENFRGAFGAYRQAVELDPKLIEAQILLGQMFLMAKKPDEAAARVQLALEQEPKNPEALLLAAGLAMAQNQADKALDYLKQVRQLDPHKTSAYIMQASMEVKQDPDAAAATLDAGIKANPQALELYVVRARLAEAQKKLEEAENFLRQALALDKETVKVQAELARHYAQTGQLDKAEKALQQQLVLEPGKEAHALTLAKFYLGRGQATEAEKTLTEFIAKHPDNNAARFALADFYLARRQEFRAKKTLQAIIDKDPNSPSGLQAKGQLANILAQRGHLDEAEKLVSEVLKENPKDMAATRTKGLIALAQKNGLEAVNNFRLLTQDQPQNAESRLLLARSHYLNKEPELAKEQAKKAVELKADFIDARRFLYAMFIQAKDYDGLIQLLQGYLQRNNKDLFNLDFLGDVYLQKGDAKAARATYQKMIDLEPDNPVGYVSMAEFFLRQKQNDQAANFLEQALKKNPNYLPALQRLVALYQTQNQPAKALEAVKRSLALSPKNPLLHQMLGEVLLVQKQPAAAAKALEDAFTLNPRQLAALQLLVLAYQQSPDQEKVYKGLEERAANPASPPFYSLVLAMLAERQKNYDKALAIYDQMLQRNLYTTLARNNMAYLLAEHLANPANLDKALTLATEALDEAPEDPNLLDTVGWIYCKKGEFAKGLTYLEQAINAAPDHPVLRYHLGWCQAKLGDKDNARKNLEKFLETKTAYPEKAEAEKLLKELQ